MVHKLLKGLVVSAASALVATVAVQSVALAAEPVTLHWLEWWDPEWGVDVMDGLTREFEEKTGIKVERTAVPWDSMYDLLVADAQGGGTNSTSSEWKAAASCPASTSSAASSRLPPTSRQTKISPRA